MFDIAIIGAGVVGGMIARALARYRLSICILERESDVSMGATRANSGIVHAGFDALPGTLKASLNVRGAQLMEEAANQLGVEYRRNGSLVLSFGSPQEDAALSALLERGRQNGVQGLRLLDRQELHRLEPSLSDGAVRALYAPTGAIICPYSLAIAAVGNAMDNGAQLRTNFPVDSAVPLKAGYELRAGGDAIQARYVVNAAGIYADRVAALLGDASFTISPRRGQYLLLDQACGGLLSHTLFQTPTRLGKGILATPTADGNLLLGPTAEDLSDRGDTATTAQGLRTVWEQAEKLLPGLPAGKVITSFSGLRAVGGTGDFLIFGGPNVLHVAGIESPGLSASPAIAGYVVERLRERGLELREKEHYQPGRKSYHAFRRLPAEEKNRIIRQDGRFGRIICRCETVTEGEIVEAIHRNPPAVTLDAVKRRTRSGMGRCQGGFCTPALLEILARETDVPLEHITKSGGGSYLAARRTKGG